MTKKTTSKKKAEEVKVAKFDKKEIQEVLGECHDGEDVKLLMKDGTVKIVSKLEHKKALGE